MKRLHHAFKLLLDKDKRSKSEVARAAQLDLSVVSRLSHRDNDISAAAMGRLARAFPTESDQLSLMSSDQLSLMSAWVQDKVEEAGFDLPQLRDAFGVEGGLTIPPSLREDLRLLLRDVKHDGDPIIELIHALAVWAKPAGETEGRLVAEGHGPVIPPQRKAVSYRKVGKVRK